MKELKPCPFCGSEAEIIEPDCDGYYRVICKNNNCSMGYPDAWYDSKEELTRDWNTRQDSNWISVNSSIKPDSYEVLCINKYKDQIIGHLQQADDGSYECVTDYETLLHVTHWQPLLEGPK